jgi:1-acyl-sn-glycerol-3-phosphate acyltransferase
MRLMGWRVAGVHPPFKKFVLIGAPHTSNMDSVFMLLATAGLGFDINWFAKAELFRGWRAPLMRLVGAIPLDRTTSTDAVDQAIKLFKERDKFVLVLSPEGTRQKVKRWRSGFYYIALDAGVPLVCGFADYKKRAAGIDRIVYPTGDLQKDFEPIREFYSGVTARYPDQVGELRVLPRMRSRGATSTPADES